MLTSYSGNIQHVGFPENYLPNRECTFTIRIPSNQQIAFYFNRFDLEQSSQCRNDFIEIIKLDNNERKRLIGRYCGNSGPSGLRINTRKLFIRFKSNGNIEKRGFRLYYKFETLPKTTTPSTRTTTVAKIVESVSTTPNPGNMAYYSHTHTHEKHKYFIYF